MDSLPHALKLTIISAAVSIMTVLVPKLAVALLLARVFTPHRSTNIAFIILTTILLAMGVMEVIITFVVCDPVPGQWDPYRYHPKCWNPSIQIDTSIATGGESVHSGYRQRLTTTIALSAFLDLTFAVYPAVQLWSLEMSRERKGGAIVLMGLGLLYVQ